VINYSTNFQTSKCEYSAIKNKILTSISHQLSEPLTGKLYTGN